MSWGTLTVTFNIYISNRCLYFPSTIMPITLRGFSISNPVAIELVKSFKITDIERVGSLGLNRKLITTNAPPVPFFDRLSSLDTFTVIFKIHSSLE